MIFSAILFSQRLGTAWIQECKFTTAVFSFCRILNYSSLIKDYKTLWHYLQHEVILSYFLLSSVGGGGEKQAGTQLLLPTMSMNMSVYCGASTCSHSFKT